MLWIFAQLLTAEKSGPFCKRMNCSGQMSWLDVTIGLQGQPSKYVLIPFLEQHCSVQLISFSYLWLPWSSSASSFLKNLFDCAQVSVAAHRIQSPDQGSNPGSLHWQHRVIAIGTAGKSQGPLLNCTTSPTDTDTKAESWPDLFTSPSSLAPGYTRLHTDSGIDLRTYFQGDSIRNPSPAETWKVPAPCLLPLAAFGLLQLPCDSPTLAYQKMRNTWFTHSHPLNQQQPYHQMCKAILIHSGPADISNPIEISQAKPIVEVPCCP